MATYKQLTVVERLKEQLYKQWLRGGEQLQDNGPPLILGQDTVGTQRESVAMSMCTCCIRDDWHVHVTVSGTPEGVSIVIVNVCLYSI